VSIQIKPSGVSLVPTFEPKSLVVSRCGERVYLVTNKGSSRHFSGLRLSGGEFEHSDVWLKEAVVPFHGEVVIKSDV
jgi:hypothetical protein